MKISGVIIAKNEEKIIVDALKSLSFCDEIIVINNDSEDNTKKVSEKYGAQVYDISSNDLSEIRNLGLKNAKGDWILYLDSDERITEELRANLLKILNSNTNFSAFRLKRKNFYLGKNEWPYIEKLERFFSKGKLKGWYGELHESPTIEGDVGEMEGYILHFTHRDLESMLDKTIEWSTTEALLRFNNNHPRIVWWRFPRVMITSFLSSYIKQKGFKAGTVGIIESIYQSFSSFITYVKLWEIQNQADKK